MSDLISRQDAIDAFGLSEKTRKYGGDHSGYDTMMLYEIQDVLESLPSADAVQIPIKLEKRYPQSRDEDITDAFMRGYLAGRSSADRPTGEWIYAKEQLEIVPMWECSCCRTRISKKFNYCPNCGARMLGEDGE